jgi:hypothetical protein
MADKIDNTSGGTPLYRERTAEGTPRRKPDAASKPLENMAKLEVAQGVVGGKTTGEVGGPKGLEPTRFGDWERDGRCVDF